MTILLAGANGQVGWEVARQAKAQNIELRAFDRGQLDITDPAAIKARVAETGATLVINAAAYTAVDKAEQEPEQAFAINRDGPANLAAACAEQGIPLLHISTDYVFDGSKTEPYREDDPVNPLGVYGASKLAGEEVIRATLEQHIILRTSWVFGSHGHNFVKTILRLAGKGDPLRIVADQQGAPTSAHSIASCLLDLARRQQEEGSLPWGTYHFSGQPHTTWHGFATEIVSQASLLGLAPKVEVNPIAAADFPTPAKRPQNSRLETSKIKSVGFLPEDWRTGLPLVLALVVSESASG